MLSDNETQRAWQKENTVVITMRLQKKTDADILSYLEGKAKQTIIKDAIREYMQNHDGEDVSRYKCVIYSDSSLGREYGVNTKNAMKCAEMYGRCEAGEVVSVLSKTGSLLSRVLWSPEKGGHYYKAFQE